MKGPRRLSKNRRFSLYLELKRHPLVFSEKDLSLFIQNSRLDPRLAESVTEHLRDYWWKYDPRSLNKKLKRQPWPAAVKPMLFQLLESCKGSRKTKIAFGQWAAEVLQGLPNSDSPALYFISSLEPRSRSLDREVNESLESFRKAGYFAKDLLFNKGQAGFIKSSADLKKSLGRAEDRLKLNLLERLRERMNDQKSLAKLKAGLDRNTFSKIKSGRLDRVGLKLLSRALDLIRE